MKMLRNLVLMAAAALTLAAPAALAADLPMMATKNPSPFLPVNDPWTGIYIGANLGHAWNTTGQDAFITDKNVDTLIGSLASSPQGFAGGLHAGVGQRFGGGLFYIGAETDIEIAALHGSAAVMEAITTKTKQNWFGSTRARLGFIPFPHLMLYGTGGVAYGNLEESFTLADVGSLSTSTTKTGWAFGAGAEVALGNNWLARAEWIRYDLGHVDLNSGPNMGNITVTATGQVDFVRGGLSYKF